MGDDGENAEARADEVEALQAIFEDELTVHDSGQWHLSVTVADGSVPCVLRVHFPDGYPSREPPLYDVSARWLQADDRRTIEAALHKLYEEADGEGVVFAWVEHLKDVIERYDPATRAPAMPLQAEATAAATSAAGDVVSLGERVKGLSVGSQEEDIGVYIPIRSGPKLEDRKSVFQAHACQVHSVAEVKNFMAALLTDRKIAAATHNIMAYSVEDREKGCVAQDCDDDGEHGAGARLSHLLEMMGVRNMVVVVTRWYGGIHLGPDRFKHINNLARIILEEFGFGGDRGGKKVSRKAERAAARAQARAERQGKRGGHSHTPGRAAATGAGGGVAVGVGGSCGGGGGVGIGIGARAGPGAGAGAGVDEGAASCVAPWRGGSGGLGTGKGAGSASGSAPGAGTSGSTPSGRRKRGKKKKRGGRDGADGGMSSAGEHAELPAGALVCVRVKPNARRGTRVTGVDAGELQVDLSEPATDGRANAELVAVLASLLGVPKAAVELRSGHKRRSKVLSVAGVAVRDVVGRLDSECSGGTS